MFQSKGEIFPCLEMPYYRPNVIKETWNSLDKVINCIYSDDFFTKLETFILLGGYKNVNTKLVVLREQKTQINQRFKLLL